jgi:hypothetical protein
MESHRKIVGGARLRRRADGGAILGIYEAGGAGLATSVSVTSRPQTSTGRHPDVQADQRLDQFVLAVARDACDPDNLAAPTVRLTRSTASLLEGFAIVRSTALRSDRPAQAVVSSP